MWSVVGGLTTVIWSVVSCRFGRWLNNHNLVGGWLLFWLVVGFFTAIGRWSVVFQIGGRWFLWSVVGYFLGKWSVVGGRWCLVVVGVTVVGGLWLVGGQGFCTTPFLRGKEKRSESDKSKIGVCPVLIRSSPKHSCDNHFLT